MTPIPIVHAARSFGDRVLPCCGQIPDTATVSSYLPLKVTCPGPDGLAGSIARHPAGKARALAAVTDTELLAEVRRRGLATDTEDMR